AEGRRIAAAEVQQAFDLSGGPLIRFRLLKLNDDDHVLLVTMHHIVTDAWSIGILMREIGILYEACSSRRPSPLPDLPIQYADYTRWQRESLKGEAFDKELA